MIQQRVVQGGSTITQQFVKNALAAQDDRTVFQKLREAALAFQITRKWSKERILRNYLNTIYFGNGAYGIESAAKTYFGSRHPGCGEPGQRRCAAQLDLEEAALLAGIVASPSGYDPLAPPARGRRAPRPRARPHGASRATSARRSGRRPSAQSLPTRSDIQPPAEDTAQPYFTSWIKQQVVDRLGGGQEGARLAFEGGLTVRTTLDTELQDAAQLAVDRALPYTDGPRAALVALENRSGEVLAMVGGGRLPHAVLQPRHAGAAPAGLGVQAVRARPGAEGRRLRELRVGVAQARLLHQAEGERRLPRLLRGEQLRGRLRRPHHAGARDDVLGQRGLREPRDPARHAEDRHDGPPARDPHARLAQPGDDPRRPARRASRRSTWRTRTRPSRAAASSPTGRSARARRSEGAQAGLPVPGPVGLKTIGRFDDGRLRPIELPERRARRRTSGASGACSPPRWRAR